MSSRVEQKIGKSIYVYEVQSYWDKNDKKAKQKKTYLGKRDPVTGNIEKKLSVFPKLAKEFGCIYFLHEIYKKIGLHEIIQNVFPEICGVIENLLAFKLSERKPLYLFETWSDNVEVNNLANISSARISDLMIDIGNNEKGIDLFFQKWIAKNAHNESLFYDITSFSSYSELIDIFEWGYNRDKESLPQINFGLIMAYPSCMPLFYQVYPGSITDVTTLINISKKLSSYKLNDFTFILDRGFYSQKNITEIYNMNNFIMPMPFTTSISQTLLNRTSTILDSNLLSKMVQLNSGRTVFCDVKKIKIENKKLYAHVFVDSERKTKSINNLFKIIDETEKEFNNATITRKKDIAEFFVIKKYRDIRNYFITIKKGCKYVIKKKDSPEMQNLIVRMGKTILITKDENISSKKIIDRYFQKDVIEKVFDDLKNELNEKKLRASNKHSLHGRLFFNFISSIVQSHIHVVLRNNNKINSLTISEIMNELKKIKCVYMHNNKKYITEISKTQKNIFKAFKIKLPSQTC
jgi:transposase